MTQKTIIGDIPSFIGGRLVEPGTVIDIDLDDAGNEVPVAAPSTPIGNMTLDEMEAYVRAKRKTVADSVNLADPSDTNTGVVNVPIADITPRSASSRLPQGIPAGSVEINGAFYAPVAPEAPGGREQFSAPHLDEPVTEPNPGVLDVRGTFDHDGNGEPGGSLTKAEIVAALKDRGDDVDQSKTKAELQAQLAKPPSA